MSKIVTPEFRGSFVHLLEPHAIKGVENAKARYQITMPILKKDPFWAKLNALVDETAKAKWGKIPQKMKSPVKDGDDDDRPEFVGCFTLQATSNNKPGIVDAQLNPIMDAGEIYSGAYYRASIRAYAWDHPTGGKGVSIALDNIMKTKDGEAFSGRTDASEDFADFASNSHDDMLL